MLEDGVGMVGDDEGEGFGMAKPQGLAAKMLRHG